MCGRRRLCGRRLRFIGTRRKRRHLDGTTTNNSTADEYTRFKENIPYTVLVPGAYRSGDQNGADTDQCRNIVFVSILLTVIVAFFAVVVINLSK